MEIFDRIELKYLIPKEKYSSFIKDLAEYVSPDNYNGSNNKYNIFNIYYDTVDDLLIKKSIANEDYTCKLRLRAYKESKSKDIIYIELKQKKLGVIHKSRSVIRLKEALDFLKTGDIYIQDYMNASAINEISNLLNLHVVVPKAFISYKRNAYFSKNDESLRITFDTNIQSRRDNLVLEVDKKHLHKQLLNDNVMLMEIKTNNDIPFWLIKLLCKYRIHNIGYSKYGTEYKNNRMIKL